MSALQSARPNARLLLVDDHALFRTGLRLIVQDHPSVGAIAEAGSIADACALQQADIDLVLLDIKSYTPELYRRLTGVELQPTLDFAQRLDRLGRKMWIRFVLVPGLTDDPDNVNGLADFVASLKTVERVEVVPFHNMGKFKWEALGLDYQLGGTEPPTPESIAAVQQVFASRGLETV